MDERQISLVFAFGPLNWSTRFAGAPMEGATIAGCLLPRKRPVARFSHNLPFNPRPPPHPSRALMMHKPTSTMASVSWSISFRSNTSAVFR